MTRTFTQDGLVSDDPFYTVVGNSIQGSYIPAGSGGTGTGGSTSGSVMSVTSGGVTINLILDAAAQAAPASFKNGLQQAVAILAANITDKITVNIKIDYSGTGGGAAAGPDVGYYENYSWVRSELVNNASLGDTTFNSLPTGTSIQGQSSVAVWNAQLKLWGVIGANDTTTDDASAYFSTDINPNLLVGVALHELTHAMGRVPYGAAPDVFDFYRYTSSGVRLFQGGATAPAAYFSLDGGATKLADYGLNSDPSDFLNSGVQGPNDPFNEYYTGSTSQTLSTVDLKQLAALGFHVGSPDLSEYVAVDKTTVAAGGSLTIDAYNMNLGSGTAGQSTAAIYLSTDATITTSDTLLATVATTTTLATVSQPGYYDHQTLTVSVPGNLAAGTYYVGGIADYNNQVNESNETNNTYNVVQITVTGPPQSGLSKPDLTEYVALSKTTAAAGSTLSVDAYNMNLGNAVAGPTTAGIYLSTDSTITTSDTLLTTVATSTTLATVSQPGYYDHQTVTVSLPGNLAPGTYYIGGISDYNNQVNESNETNNTYNVVQVTVTASPQPDLSEYVAVNKTIVAAGTGLTIDAYNMNLGNAVAASPTTAGIYLSSDATITTSDTLLTTLTTSATLATVSQPGYYDHQTVTVTLPSNLAPGTYYIGGISDYNNHLTESNETNNTYNVVQITVTAAGSSSPAAQTPTVSSPMVQAPVNGDNGLLGALLFGHSNVQDNFALSRAFWTDHAQLTELASLAARIQEPAATTEAAGAHLVFDHLPDVMPHYFGDYHLV
jgi:subtilase family serine protease